MEKKEDQAPKEHKPNWRETRAKEEDIQNFLMSTLYLRHNVITGKDEFRVPEISEYAAMGIKYPTGKTPLDEWRSPDQWYEVEDRLVNTLCSMLSKQKDVNVKKIWQVIDDDSGTRRWLTFEVESIRSPYEYPIHHDEIFAQAYALYLKGFHYWFEGKETDIVQLHNQQFEVPKPEQELVSKYYRVPAKGEACEFVSATEIMQTIGGLLINRLTANKLGRAMKAMGFVSVRSRGQRGYNVVAYKGADIDMNKTLMAGEAKPENEVSVVSHEAILDAFDTLF